MKVFFTITCMVLLTLFADTACSQNRRSVKPLLFGDFPATINCTEAQLSNLFTAQKNEVISLPLTNNFILSGPIANKLVKYNNLQTIIIKLAAFKNTLFSLSRQTDQHNNNVYVGKILNPLYADGYDLKRNAQGNYQLIKIDIEKILVNCNQ